MAKASSNRNNMASVFVLTGNRKGQTIMLHGRYQFVNGVMIVPDAEAAAAQRSMMKFYGAVEITLQEYETAMASQNQAKVEEVAKANAPAKPAPAIVTTKAAADLMSDSKGA